MKNNYNGGSVSSSSSKKILFASATIALMLADQQVQGLDIKSHTKTNQEQKNKDDAPDSIAMSSNDDMFAFSQIVSSGGNPMQVAAEMEKELNKPKAKAKGVLDDDTAVAAYAEFMGSGGSFEEDPAKVAAAKAKKDQEAKATAELKDLEGNDSTSAFAALVTAQSIEGRAENFKGSGQDDDEDDKPKKKKLIVKVKKQDTAILQEEEVVAPMPPPQVVEEKPAPVEPPKKKLVILPKKKKGLKKTEEEKASKPKKISQLKKKQVRFDDPKPLPEAAKEDAEPAVPEATADDKAVDAQADALLDNIKDIASNIKTAGNDGDEDAQTKALDLLAKMNLLQTKSQISIEPEADLAMEYLAAQFPDDYEKDPVVKKAEPVLSEIEQVQKDSKETMSYAKDVLNDAEKYHDEIEENLQKKSDSKKSALEIAGMATNTNLQLGNIQSDKDLQVVSLAQTSSSNNLKQKIKNKEKLAVNMQGLSKLDLGLSADQLQFLSQMNSQGGLEVEDQNQNQNQNQAVDTSSQDMRAYSESVAQAAEVVNTESDQQAQLDAKAAIVAQAEATNSAAMDGPATASSKASSKLSVKPIAVSAASELSEKAEQQKKLQYQADKQSALDQGYTKDQAEQYASQEQYAAGQAQTATATENKPKDVVPPEEPASSTKTVTVNEIGPASGQTIVPPTQPGDKSANARLTQEEDPASMSIQQQILAAQQQQEVIKAALEKKKGGPENIQQAADLQAGEATTKEQQAMLEAQKQMDSMSPEEIAKMAAGGDQPAAAAAPVEEVAAPVAAAVVAVPAEVAAPAKKLTLAQKIVAATKNKKAKAQKPAKSQALVQAQAEAQAQLQAKAEVEAQAQAQAQVQAQAEAQAQVEAQAQAQAQAQVDAQAVVDAQAQAKAQEVADQKAAAQQELEAQKAQAEKEALELAAAKAKIMLEAEKKKKATQVTKSKAVKPIAAKAATKSKVSTPKAKSSISLKQVTTDTKKPVEEKQKLTKKATEEKEDTKKATKPEKENTHKKDHDSLQQQEDIRVNEQMENQATETKEDAKKTEEKKTVESDDKGQHKGSRAVQYESDLNKARDDIETAQEQMKSIDTEVQNFHQKMAKSMHSLLKAFTEGFDAMDKAKAEEVEQLQLEKDHREQTRVKKLDKLHSGISNLEALTSKLKMSFDGEEKKESDDANVQQKEEVNVNEKDVAPTDQTFLNSKIKDDKKQVKLDDVKKPEVTATKTQPVVAAKVTKVAPKQVAAQETTKAVVSKPAATTSKMVAPAKQAVKQNSTSPKVVAKSSKMVTPMKTVAVKPAAVPVVTAKKEIPAGEKTDLKAKMQALLTQSAKKKSAITLSKVATPSAAKTVKKPVVAIKKINLIQKNLQANKAKKNTLKPLTLAQISSSSEIDADSESKIAQATENFSQMKSLLETNLNNLRHAGFTGSKFSKSKPEDTQLLMTSQKQKNAAAQKLIANSMAQRVLAQLQKGKDHKEILKDMDKTQQAFVLAKKAYYDKDPEAIALLQLDSTVQTQSLSDGTQQANSEVIMLTDDNTRVQRAENIQLSQEESLGTGPSENEEEIQTLLDTDESS